MCSLFRDRLASCIQNDNIPWRTFTQSSEWCGHKREFVRKWTPDFNVDRTRIVFMNVYLVCKGIKVLSSILAWGFGRKLIDLPSTKSQNKNAEAIAALSNINSCLLSLSLEFIITMRLLMYDFNVWCHFVFDNRWNDNYVDLLSMFGNR